MIWMCSLFGRVKEFTGMARSVFLWSWGATARSWSASAVASCRLTTLWSSIRGWRWTRSGGRMLSQHSSIRGNMRRIKGSSNTVPLRAGPWRLVLENKAQAFPPAPDSDLRKRRGWDRLRGELRLPLAYTKSRQPDHQGGKQRIHFRLLDAWDHQWKRKWVWWGQRGERGSQSRLEAHKPDGMIRSNIDLSYFTIYRSF